MEVDWEVVTLFQMLLVVTGRIKRIARMLEKPGQTGGVTGYKLEIVEGT